MSIEKSSTLCINEKYKLQTFFETRRQKFKILRSMLFEKYCKIRKKIMKKRAAEDEKKFTNDVNNFVKEVNGNDGDDDFVDY